MMVKLLFIIIRVGELKLIRQSIILFLGEPLTMGFLLGTISWLLSFRVGLKSKDSFLVLPKCGTKEGKRRTTKFPLVACF